ncbi:sulfatase family protein [Rhodopirellula halodulae]|uniref:sulfatase family protein n=1 Tax=Rhodopirellula halodulae TaxID=2894198 RepID=UPI001E552A6F|nr:sulfatase [Rhodopirellula sp. JC737]MCC9657121.1 sulfatase [Rhodopirellula sp. JC737]
MKSFPHQSCKLALAACCVVLLAAKPIKANDQPLNVVVILSDDQAWTDYSFMGHPHIETPNLDRLAKESLTFTRGYSPVSLCRPSLATIISGLYPHQHGIVGNDPPWPGMEQGVKRPAHQQPQYVKSRMQYLQHVDALDCQPELLAPHGYRSLQTGKWWEGKPSRAGFTDAMTHGDFTRDGRHGDSGLKIGRNGMKVIDDFLADTQSKQQPFYLWYAPFLPHTPHNPPERLLAKYREKTDSLPIAKYWAMCEWFDETCGELLGLLDQYSLTNNTLVIYVTDNGWINRTDASRYAPRSKRSPNEGGTRTPIMYRLPGVIEPRMDNEHLVSTIDVVPTTMSLLGLETPNGLPGINVLNETSLEERQAIYGEIFEHDIQSMDNPADSLQYRWVIQGNYKLIDPSSRMTGRSPELYNLKLDPHENRNLADQQPEKVQSLQTLLDAWYAPDSA